MSIWDDAEIRTGGEFIKFDAIGDTVTGTITAIRKHTFDDGKAVPQLFLDVDGEERTLTAGQVRLKAELAIQRPEVGDTLTVTLANVEKRAGGKTLSTSTCPWYAAAQHLPHRPQLLRPSGRTGNHRPADRPAAPSTGITGAVSPRAAARAHSAAGAAHLHSSGRKETSNDARHRNPHVGLAPA